MSSMTVKFEWDEEELGPCWMNPDNLRILLYTSTLTYKKLLSMQVLDEVYVERVSPLQDSEVEEAIE